MKQWTIAHPAANKATFSLDGLTRGFRLLSWLKRRSETLWIEGWTGALVLASIRFTRLRPRVAWQGPLARRSTFGVPALSWFEVPLRGTIYQSFFAALNDLLDKETFPSPPADIDVLVRRVLAAHVRYPRCAAAGPARSPSRAHGAARVLLVDEREWTSNPCTKRPCSSRESFERMVAEAVNRHPNGEFWLLRSVDAGMGKWLSRIVTTLPTKVRLIDDRDVTSDILYQMDHVYTVSASEGMFALLAGASVHVFGGPYYAGWGLTDDHVHLPGRNARPTPVTLFHAVFILLARYLDPLTHEPGNIEAVLDSIELQRNMASRFKDLGRVTAVGFQWWKRPFVTPFLTVGGGVLRWTAGRRHLGTSEYIATWGARDTHELSQCARHIRVEDGFLHSCGLGSDLSAPCSQVVDRRGIYFDSTTPNELTELLNSAAFDPFELTRAAALREQIVRSGLTKYNLGRRRPQWMRPPGRRIVLVPGQVDDDASIRLGCASIKTIEALLREVRARRPDAWVVYRPHPDVLSGNRTGVIDARRVANEIDRTSDIVSLIEIADEVHTLSSLAGFDALLRGKAVFTYGMPFYAGWGLTHDAVSPIPWRTRTLSLDMLLAGVMLRYPLYWDWQLRLFTTPEAIVRQLATAASHPLGQMRATPARSAMKTWRWLRNVFSHVLWLCLQAGTRTPGKRSEHN